jgi:very-short-patch-repair endonuclease
MARDNAKALRANMTDAERRLWYLLRAHRFQSFKFKRQVPIGGFIVDFVCFDRRILIEVDGGQHADSEADAGRDRWLQHQGFRVLRFWNNEVLNNTDAVLELILGALSAAAPSPGTLRAPPSPARGEGKKDQ